jgi:hypothetical protein
MKVKDLIEQLQRDYKPEDSLLVAYWDKEYVETALEEKLEGKPYPIQAWEDAIRRAEDKEYWQSCGSEEIVDQADEALKDYKEESK